MNSDLSLDFLRVVEQAAIACAHTMGQGDAHKSDHAAVEAMRESLDTVMIDGTIVIGEGERDEAPMLYIGEKVGMGTKGDTSVAYPEVDIAVDPLEGTNLCALGTPNALAVLAASEGEGLLHAPDLYMEKLVVGPSSREVVDLDAPVRFNLRAIAQALGRGQHGQRVGGTECAQVGALERIDGNVHLREATGGVALRSRADLLADVEHRRFVALAFADDDGAVDRQRIHLLPHRFDSHLIGEVPIALPHRVCAGDGRLLDDADEVEREVGVKIRVVRRFGGGGGG